MAGTDEPTGPGGPKPPLSGGGPSPPPPARKDPPPDPLKAEVPCVPVDRLREMFPDEVEEVSYHAGEASARVGRGRLVEILRFLRDDDACRMDLLMDQCGADYPDREERFEILYHLYSIPRGHFLRLRVRTSESDAVSSATAVWSTANWFEREIFDLFGVRFADHPDLRRILMPDDWQGHPLRKEYPLSGFPDQHLKLR